MLLNNHTESPLLREIRPRNLLSFGPDTPALELENLNVFIGPNGVGKSNLIEAVALLRATPVPPQTTSNADVRGVIRQGGGVSHWIWKGLQEGPAFLEVVVSNPYGLQPLRHCLAFREENQAFRMDDERIENATPDEDQTFPYFYYNYNRGDPVLKVSGEERGLKRETVDSDLSILAQRRDPENYPEISYLAGVYGEIRVYREWTFGRKAVFRDPQQADMRNERLEENFSNLGLFLNHLRRKPKAKQTVLAKLQDLYDGINDFDISVEGGTVQVFFTEGDFTIPATRLSDGALRYLCLLAILCDPEPPPLICLEEPELGLHPDILPKLADLLVAASERTQLIVTTHSDILVDAMTDRPETIVVCEKHDGQTIMTRLQREELQCWLDKYRLGQLWTKGQIGGTRW